MPNEGGKPGFFVTLEGPEGSGKTSHARRLAEWASGRGLTVVLTREPGGTLIGERIRETLLSLDRTEHDPRTDALLFNAARARLVAEVIRPALTSGSLVVCARYADSTLAYQGDGAGVPIDELRFLEGFATGGLQPDLTLLLDVSPEIGLARKTGVERTRFEAYDLAFHQRVRDGFLRIAATQRDRIVVIAADADEATVFEQIRAVVAERLGLPAVPDREIVAAAHRIGEPEAPRERIRS